jgi:hypothetical protein
LIFFERIATVIVEIFPQRNRVVVRVRVRAQHPTATFSEIIPSITRLETPLQTSKPAIPALSTNRGAHARPFLTLPQSCAAS